MKAVFFTIFLAAAQMQVNSLKPSPSTDSKLHSSAVPSNPLAISSFTEKAPEAVHSFDFESLIASVTKLPERVIDKSLTHLNALGKILTTNSPLGSLLYGMQFLFENQQMLKIMETTGTELNNNPTDFSDRNNADDKIFQRTTIGLPHRNEKDERVNDHLSEKPGDKTSRRGKSKVDKTSSASSLPANVKSNSATREPDAEMDEAHQLLLQSKETLLEHKDTSGMENITRSKARETNTPGNLGYLIHYGDDDRIWRTKNTDMIIKMVYDHDFSMIRPEDGHTVYQSADGIVRFMLFGNKIYMTNINLHGKFVRI